MKHRGLVPDIVRDMTEDLKVAADRLESFLHRFRDYGKFVDDKMTAVDKAIVRKQMGRVLVCVEKLAEDLPEGVNGETE
jgi:hypothetical protein